MQVDQNASFVQFVYPFHFNPDEFTERAKAMAQARWPGREPDQTMLVWAQYRLPTGDLLPHVANYLHPPEGQQPTARLWELDPKALSSARGLGAQATWSLVCPGDAVSFRVEAVRAMLFRIGVGFLTVRARPTGTDAPDWFDFVHFFRFTDHHRATGVQAQRSTRKDQSIPFFPSPAGGIEGHPDGRGTFGEVLDALLRTGALPWDTGPWWHDVFVPGQMMPFVSLFVDGVPENEIPGLVYRARSFFHHRQDIHPSSADLRMDNQSALLHYTATQWFAFSLDGGAFVSCNAPDQEFFRKTLPEHLDSDYFLLYLLALHQRFALTMLSETVAQRWPIGEHRPDDAHCAALFAQIRDGLLSFTARGYFAQVMQREQHHRCYRKWQETFQLERLYREVRDEVQDMHEYLEARRQEQVSRLAQGQLEQREMETRIEEQRERATEAHTRRVEQRVTQMATIVGVPLLTLTFMMAAGLVELRAASAAVVGGLAVGFLACLGLTRAG